MYTQHISLVQPYWWLICQM